MRYLSTRSLILASALLLTTASTIVDGSSSESRQNVDSLLASSRTVYLAPGTQASRDLMVEIERKLDASGRLLLVPRPADADLILAVRKVHVAQVQAEEPDVYQYTAVVKHRRSGVDVWSVVRRTSGMQGLPDRGDAWAGRTIADDFVRVVDRARRRAAKE
jgi:hypothetical protein